MAGTGTVIRETLHHFGITAHGCGCTDLANEMDTKTPEEIESNLELYVGKMRESIKKWRRSSGITVPQPPDFTIRLLIQYAIGKAKV